MEFQLFHTTLSASLLLFIMAGGFLAGFVDSIAGGGGLISLPVLLAAGLPPHLSEFLTSKRGSGEAKPMADSRRPLAPS